MKIKIIVLGSNGMAGHMISDYLSFIDNYSVIRIARDNSLNKTDYILDVTDFDNLKNLIDKLKPNVIINAIGILNSDAENNPDKSILINSYLPHFLAKVSEKVSASLIHISTDCVFSGNKGQYNEYDHKDGIGFYAQSKAIGEVLYKNNLTIRTSIIGPDLKSNGIGLLNWILNQDKFINGYTNAYWSGVTTLELAKSIDFIIKNNLFYLNLIHLTNSQKISKYNLIDLINDVFKLNLTIQPSSNYKVDKSLINTNDNFIYNVPSYKIMIIELYNWIILHKGEYNYIKL